LEESAWSVANRIQSEECDEDTLPNEKDRYFFASILCAIGEIDSESSHSSLLQFYSSVRNTHLKAAVLSAMSLEDSMFDINFVVDILEQEASEPIISSGLCAVMLLLYRFDSTIWWRAVVSNLNHPSAEVRACAIRALATTGGPETRPEIAKLLDDADPEVRKTAAWMLKWVDHKG
jgi:HEAT repeat protein